MATDVNYLSYLLQKCYADTVARYWPAQSLATRRRIVAARPQYIDEKLRLCDTLNRLGIDARDEHADLCNGRRIRTQSATPRFLSTTGCCSNAEPSAMGISSNSVPPKAWS